MISGENQQKIIGASWMVPIHQDASKSKHQDQVNDTHQNFGLLLCDDKIQDIAPFSTLVTQFPDVEAEFLDDHILMPGLVNCHGHAAMSLMRGMADDYPLNIWLEEHIWPVEAEWSGESFVADGATLAIAEMLLSGTTSFSDMYFFPETTARIAEKIGIRAQINFPIIESPNNWASSAEQHIERGLTLFDEYRHSERISIGFGPHAPYTVSNDSFERIAMLAEEVDTHIQVHLQETAGEIQASIDQYGVNPTQRLNQLGILGPRTQVVHVTHCNEQDIQIFTDTGTRIIHCPVSNQKLASGYCSIRDLLTAELTIGLGTDSAASNNTLDLFETAKSASLQAKLHYQDPTLLNAKKTIEMATIDGAKVLDMEKSIGSLSIGKQADIIAINCLEPAMQPVHNPLSQLAYASAGQFVNHVWVNGKQLVKNRKLLTIETHSLISRCKQWKEKLRK